MLPPLDPLPPHRFGWGCQRRPSVWGYLGATSTDHAPWFVVPADDKHNARLIVSEIILDTYRSLDMAYPKTGEARKRELRAIRKKLVNERE